MGALKSGEQLSGSEIFFVKPLTLEEIQKVVQKNIGIRNTTRERAGQEAKDGVNGDFLVISDLSGLLDPDENHERMKELQKWHINPFEIVRKNQDWSMFKNLELLPEEFHEQLKAFIGNILQYGEFLDEVISESTMLGDYLEKVMNKMPVILVIESQRVRDSYDKGKYHGFGKSGKHLIESSEIVGQVSTTEEDEQFLLEKYRSQSSTSEAVEGRERARNAFDSVENDIVQILLSRTIQAIRERL